MKGNAESAETEKSLKNVTKWAGLVFLGMVISKVLNYLFRLVVANYYGPEYYGLISIGISTVIMLVSIILLGLDSGAIRFTAFYNAKKDKPRVRGAIVTPFRICVPLAIAVSAVIWVFAPFYAGLFSVSPEQAVYLASILRIFSFSIPFIVAYSLIMSINKGLQRIKYNIYADYIFSSSLQVAFVFLFYLMGFDITGVAVAYFLSTALSFVFILYFSRGNLMSI
jgi:O-antigen/teichoic acid export membrane protein